MTEIVKTCTLCGRQYDERAWSRAEALGTVGRSRRGVAITTDYRRCVCGDGMARTVRTVSADGRAA